MSNPLLNAANMSRANKERDSVVGQISTCALLSGLDISESVIRNILDDVYVQVKPSNVSFVLRCVDTIKWVDTIGEYKPCIALLKELYRQALILKPNIAVKINQTIEQLLKGAMTEEQVYIYISELKDTCKDEPYEMALDLYCMIRHYNMFDEDSGYVGYFVVNKILTDYGLGKFIIKKDDWNKNLNKAHEELIKGDGTEFVKIIKSNCEYYTENSNQFSL